MLASLEATLYPIVVNINNYLSSYILIVLLIAVGLWYSVKTRFVQVRYFKAGIKKVFGTISLKGGKQESGMSSFQALATAIAAQVGTGNLTGAARDHINHQIAAVNMLQQLRHSRIQHFILPP